MKKRSIIIAGVGAGWLAAGYSYGFLLMPNHHFIMFGASMMLSRAVYVQLEQRLVASNVPVNSASGAPRGGEP